MTAQPKKKYTAEEYLAMEILAPYKSEYYKGEIFPMGEIEGETPEMMAGATPAHNIIFSNLFGAISTSLKGKNCMPFGSDQQVFIPQADLYTYPDLSVFCGPLQFENKLALKNPVFIIEILSKVTEAYNRGEKFEMYRSIPTLTEFLMVDSQRVHVDLWRRENNTWVLAFESSALTDSFLVKSIDTPFTLQSIYHRSLELM